MLVFLREVQVRLQDWRFWLGILSLPLLISIVAGAIVLLQLNRKPTKFYLVGEAQNLPLPSGRRFSFTVAPPLSVDSLITLLQNGEGLLAYAIDSSGISHITIHVREALSSTDLETLKQLLHTAILSRHLTELGISHERVARILAPPVVNTLVLSEVGDKPRTAEVTPLLSTLLSFLLFSLILSAGGQVLLSVLEEKTNRLAEYLLIYVTPAQLLTGKLLAGIVIAMVHALVWVGFAAGGIKFAQMAVSPLFEAFAALPWGWISFYLIGGILLYTFLYAAAGASSDSISELSSFAQSLQWPLLISFVLVSAASLQPGEAFSIFLSHFPLTSPLAMPLRLAGTTVSLIERLFALALLWGSVLGARFLAARLYQRALLMYGQKLSWKAIWNLLRE